MKQRKITSAIKMWKNIQKKGTRDYRVDYGIGMAYQAKDRLGKAALYYARALKKNPDSPQIYRSLGYCLDQLHQKDKAGKLLEKADQLDREALLKADKSNSAANDKQFPFVLI